MRLIDANSIKFRPYYDDYVDYDGYINDLKTWQLDDILSDRVDNAPTVDAIPVEWIEKKIEKLDKEAKEYDIFIREELAGYGDNVIWQKKRALVELIESWKKEKKG